MAGLGAAMEQTAPDTEEPSGEAATPEEQALYEQVVKNALEILYPKSEEEISPQIREALTAGDKPVMNLAMASLSIVQGLVASAKQAGQPIPEDVLYHAGAQIVELVGEAAEAFKIHDYAEEDIERAFYIALDLYREQATQAGDVNADELKASFDELKAANDRGELDTILPGALKHAEKTMPKEAADDAAPAQDEG
jgi:hypothetical protein